MYLIVIGNPVFTLLCDFSFLYHVINGTVMSQQKRRFMHQMFAYTAEFRVRFLVTSQYTHKISHQVLLAAYSRRACLRHGSLCDTKISFV